MKQKSELITRGPLLKNILLYTVPIILTIALQRLFNAVDLIVVGQYCGSISLSAVGATTFISNLFVNFFIGLSVGAGVSVTSISGLSALNPVSIPTWKVGWGRALTRGSSVASGPLSRTCALSAPCRYLHSPACVVKSSDLEAVKSLAFAMAEACAVL